MFDKTEVVVGGQWGGGGSVVLTASTLSLSWNRTVSLWYICCVRLDVVESDGWPWCLTGVVTSSRSAADGRKLLNVTWSRDGWWDVKYKIIYDQQPDRQQCRDGGRGREGEGEETDVNFCRWRVLPSVLWSEPASTRTLCPRAPHRHELLFWNRQETTFKTRLNYIVTYIWYISTQDRSLHDNPSERRRRNSGFRSGSSDWKVIISSGLFAFSAQKTKFKLSLWKKTEHVLFSSNIIFWVSAVKTTRSRSNLLELFFFFNKLHFTQTSLLIHQPSIHTLYSCHTVVATLRTDDRSYKGIEPPPQKPFSQFFFFVFFKSSVGSGSDVTWR